MFSLFLSIKIRFLARDYETTWIDVNDSIREFNFVHPTISFAAKALKSKAKSPDPDEEETKEKKRPRKSKTAPNTTEFPLDILRKDLEQDGKSEEEVKPPEVYRWPRNRARAETASYRFYHYASN